MKNEFDQLSEENDLEILKDIVPSWVSERVEPFISPAVDSVVPPTYNEIGNLTNQTGATTNANTTPQPGTIQVVIARQGTIMEPVLMTPVEGTLFEDL